MYDTTTPQNIDAVRAATPYPTRKDGRLTVRGLAQALADIDAKRAPILADIALHEAAYTLTGDADTDAWNAAHDALAALDYERHQATLNRAPITTWGQALAADNID